ncbi:HAE1 family efflux transporter outer membrane efflux protein [Corallococcus coralloides DSM 2259]|uniref:HAE1 family efflux transporter outer membrane efflux protein n=1 Tax=Corallococcus coralloides (strain ATCC 25202 / DSM 2259 / NBRC 100086 / M2) TaxID=1144275 RepID=H8MV31_CORCM|nr:TolC family protein [Corallococcus coralloides]AFE08463.1 HAE1 family efflux transporter outer membrane efflux protein [Corallococcus coralloides DSM 2259]
MNAFVFAALLVPSGIPGEAPAPHGSGPSRPLVAQYTAPPQRAPPAPPPPTPPVTPPNTLAPNAPAPNAPVLKLPEQPPAAPNAPAPNTPARTPARQPDRTRTPSSQNPDDVPEVPPPFQANVSDPLLTPAPAAPQEIQSWNEALTLLRQRSTDLQAVLGQVEVAAGTWRIALANLLPTVGGTLSAQYNILNPNIPAVGGGIGGGVGGGVSGEGGFTPTELLGIGVLNANVPVVDLASLYALGSAKESRRTAALSLAETRRQLTRGLAQALVSVSSNERLAEVNRVNLRTALERLALAQRRFELGAGTRLDVVRVEQDAQTARRNVVTGDENLRQAREALGLALGTPSAVGIKPGLELTTLFEGTKATCRTLESLENRPDIAAAKSRQVVAERAIGEVYRQYAPTLDLTSTTTALTVNPGFAEVPIWNVGASLVLPFWDGGAREGRLRQARGQLEQARADVTNRERNIVIEVTQAKRAVQVTQATRDLAERERRLAEENDRLTRRSFEVGTGTSLELVDAAGALRQAELELVIRDFQFRQAQVDAFLSEAACEW